MNSSVPRLLSLGLLLCSMQLPAQPEVLPLLDTTQDGLGQPLHYPSGQAARLSASVVILAPGESTGWHRHAVPVAGYLESGELTVDYEHGERRVFQAGAGIIEALQVPHRGFNGGSEPVRIVAFFAGEPGVAATEAVEPAPPADIVELQDYIPDLVVDLRYRGSNNFMGRPVAGYEEDVVLISRAAAEALQAVQLALREQGLGLKVFDAYRPQRAVDDFMRWAADPQDQLMKAQYYPKVDKSALIPDGYIAERSGHSRASTVDLTLVQLATGEELDMGSGYDFFDLVSWPSSTEVTQEQQRNRMLLREAMLAQGFVPLEQEWWHFTLRAEAHRDAYFDFPVRSLP